MPSVRDEFNRYTKTRALAFESLEARLALSVNVLTYLANSGVNAAETQLSPTNVNVNSFGNLYTTPVDGQVYAQPLIDTGITIAAGPNTTAGAAGVHNVVFVATENDSLYAIDSSPSGGAILWQRSFTNITTPGYTGTTAGTNINNPQAATSITTVPYADVDITDISPVIGITGTPVIDASTNTLYVVVFTKETIGGAVNWVQRLHAINIADGTDRVTPFLIGDTSGANANTNNTPIYVYGTGDGSVTDPYNGTGELVDQFNALRENQRSAIDLVGGQIYVDWASHGDNGPYHGWVVSWNVSNLATNGFVLSGVLNTSPNDGLSGIWQGGAGLTFDPDENAFYFETGNGSGGAPTINSAGFPTNANYNDALVKVVPDPTTTAVNQGPNGWGFKITDWFIPYNVVALDGADDDFGSGGPLILSDSAGIPGHPHLIVAAGKQGTIYVLDRDNLGHYNATFDNVVSELPNALAGSMSTPAYFNGNLYWQSGYSYSAREFAISNTGTLSITSQTAVASMGYIPGSAVVSANGTANGIVWLMDRNTNELHAYNASSLSIELWNSGQNPTGADAVGSTVKFASPTVANGEVYVGTANSLVVYGLKPPENSVSLAPVLTAASISGSSINLSWTDATVAPNLANSYLIEQSTDGVSFTQVTSAPGGSTSLAIGGLLPNTKYYFRIRGNNGEGDSPYSNVASASTTTVAALLNFSSGFASSATSITYNGSAQIQGTAAELTNGGLEEAASFFANSPVNIAKFATQFTFQLSAGTNTADGFTFTLENQGLTALGSNGEGLGFGPNVTGGVSAVINNSVAIKFDIYNNSGEGSDSTGLYVDGAEPTNVGSIDLTNTGVNLHSGDTFLVNLSYDGTTLTETITDTVTNASATETYAVNIPADIGSSTAYAGFTGGTGGYATTQSILTWTLSPNATSAPAAPTALGATVASATSISLNWTNTATNQTGYYLDRATDPGFTQNLVTQILPATPNSFTDTATGLAPAYTFYYRLRAFNLAGSSANSNVVGPITIPVAPPKPTNAIVTRVTSTEIDLQWTDNAGVLAANYQVYRSVNQGSFTLYATLPAFTADAPPNTYVWDDTGCAPATYYEYHIEAVNVSGHNDFAGTNATTLTSAGVPVAAGDPTTNLLSNDNASFESPTATNATTVPAAPWYTWGTAYLSTQYAYAGSQSVVITGSGTNGISGVAQNYYSITPGAAYTVSVDAMMTSANPLTGSIKGQVDLLFYGPSGLISSYASPNQLTVLTSSSATGGTLPASVGPTLLTAGGWNHYYTTAVAPAGATYAEVGVDTYASTSTYGGAVYFDNLEFGPSSVPAPPTALSAAAVTGGISLSWTAGANDASFNIYRGTTSGGESKTPYATGITGTSYLDASVVQGETYYYYVTAVSPETTPTAEVSATALVPAAAGDPTTNLLAGDNAGFESPPAGNSTTPPAGPWYTWGSVALSTQYAYAGLQSIVLSGSGSNGSSGAAENYYSITPGVSYAVSVDAMMTSANPLTGSIFGQLDVLFYGPNGLISSYGLPNQVPLLTSSSVSGGPLTGSVGNSGWNHYYTDAVAPAGATYAQVGVGTYANTSTYGGAIYFDNFEFGPAPVAAPPTALSAVAATGGIVLSWTAGANDTSFNIYRGTTSGGETKTPYVTGVTGTSYLDATVVQGDTYYYYVTAVSPETTPTAEVSATALVPTAAGDPTTNLLANDNSSFESPTAANSTTAPAGPWFSWGSAYLSTQYAYAGTQSIVLSGSGSNGSSGVALNYTAITPGTAYTVSVDAMMTSANPLTGTIAGHLNILFYGPNGLISNYASPNQFNILNSSSVSGGPLTGSVGSSGWNHYYTTAVAPSGATYVQVGVDTYSPTSTYGGSFYFDNFKFGLASVATPPTALSAVAGTGGITLSWTAGVNDTSFNIYRGTTSGGESKTPYATGITATSYLDASVVQGDTYYYYVTAVPPETIPTAEVSATVPMPLAAGDPPINLLVNDNPGFEAPLATSATTLPAAPWYTWGSAYLSNQYAYGGAQSIVVSGSGSNASSGVAQNYYSITPGTSYTVSVDAMMTSANPLTGGIHAQLNLMFYGANGLISSYASPNQITVLSSTSAAGGALTGSVGTSGWNHYYTTAVAPAGATYVEVGVDTYSQSSTYGGAVYFDNLEFGVSPVVVAAAKPASVSTAVSTASSATPNVTTTAPAKTTIVTAVPVVASSSAANYLGLKDAALAAVVKSLDTADGGITRAAMLSILRDVQTFNGGVLDANDMSDLKTILNDAATLNMPSYVQVLASDVISGNAANADYLGKPLGNLAVGSTETHFNDLIDKWFLGTDLPNSGGYAYSTVTGSLYAGGTPSHLDEDEGISGDCYLISALGSIADSNPAAIENMIVDNGVDAVTGLHTWTVRFYVSGTADYVTVDNQLPTSGGKLVYDGSGHGTTNPPGLWMALVEKAYAQWNETGNAGRDGTNTYASLTGGWMANVDAQVLGHTASSYDLTSTSDKAALVSAVTSKLAVTIGTDSGSALAYGLYGNHAYSVTGYNAQSGTFTLFNPWGIDQPKQALTWAQLQTVCYGFATTSTSGSTSFATSILVAVQPATTVPTPADIALQSKKLTAAAVDAFFAAEQRAR